MVQWQQAVTSAVREDGAVSQRRVVVMRRFRGRVFGPWIALLALAALVLVAGCGGGGCCYELDVVRTSVYPDNHISPFEQTVTGQAKVTRLFNALQALPAYPSGTVSCPADFGVVYQLQFQGEESYGYIVSVQAGGCQGVSFDGTSLWTRTTANRPQFWTLFAETLGVPEIELFPTPQPSGPSAPTPGP